MRPLVAIPAYHLDAEEVTRWVTAGYGLPERYVHSLRRAGASAVLVPAPIDEAPEAFLSRFDGLLLAGGGDVEAHRYGGTLHGAMYGMDPARDEAELALALAAGRMGMPVLAVCRGMQLLNVAYGGTLRPHLPEVGGLREHGVPLGGVSSVHDVRVAAGSMLAKACGEVIERCTSHHHQGVDRIGDGLVPVAWSDDGLVEALERDGGSWLVAVQWHPEVTAADDPVQQALFDAFVEQLR